MGGVGVDQRVGGQEAALALVLPPPHRRHPPLCLLWWVGQWVGLSQWYLMHLFLCRVEPMSYQLQHLQAPPLCQQSGDRPRPPCRRWEWQDNGGRQYPRGTARAQPGGQYVASIQLCVASWHSQWERFTTPVETV